MKAAMSYGIGDIRIEEIPKPACPPDGLLMKVLCVLTCGTDVKTYKRGHVLYSNERRIFGHEAAGIVAEVGPDSKADFKVGDRIVSHNTAPCDACYWCKRGQPSLCEDMEILGGTWAEYIPVSARLLEKSAFHVPDNMPIEAAPMIEPMSCAVYGADLGDIALGDTVAILGAGPLGLGLIACAVSQGARVICSDKSAARLALAKKMGAEHTVLVTDDLDQVKAVRNLTPHERGVDVAIEAVGAPEAWNLAFDMVRRGGTAVFFGGCKRGTTVTLDTERLHYDQITIKGVFHTTPRHVEMAFDLIKRGILNRDVLVTGFYTLDTCVQALEDHANQIGIKNLIRIADE